MDSAKRIKKIYLILRMLSNQNITANLHEAIDLLASDESNNFRSFSDPLWLENVEKNILVFFWKGFRYSSRISLINNIRNFLLDNIRNEKSIRNIDFGNIDLGEGIINRWVVEFYEKLGIASVRDKNLFDLARSLVLSNAPAFLDDSELVKKLIKFSLFEFLFEYKNLIEIGDEEFEDFEMTSREEKKFKVICRMKKQEIVDPESALICKDKEYIFTNQGETRYNNRSDKMILIGKNKFCNIILPKLDSLKPVSAVLFLTNSQVFFYDTLEENSCYIKIYEDENYLIQKGQVINLSGFYNVLIKDIIFRSQLESTLCLRLLNEHPEKQAREVTATKDKNIFNMGLGGHGTSQDIPILSSHSKISRDHLSFEFDQKNSKWHLKTDSKNGVFYPTKTQFFSYSVSPIPLPLNSLFLIKKIPFRIEIDNFY